MSFIADRMNHIDASGIRKVFALAATMTDPINLSIGQPDYDVDALVNAPVRGPAYKQNHPTDDHWLPLLFSLGAASEGEPVSYPVEGWEFGNLSRRSIRWG